MDERTRNLLLGFGGGIAAALAAPIVVPIVTEIARPVTKALLRGSLLGFDYARTQMARASEALEDIVAEVGAEVKTELKRRSEATSGGAVASITALRKAGEQATDDTAREAKSVS